MTWNEVSLVVSNSLWLYSTSLICPYVSPGNNTWVGVPAFLQGIFLTQKLSFWNRQYWAQMWSLVISTKHLRKKLYQFCTAAAKSLQSCPTLCDPIDSSPPGSTIPEILQARTLEWVAISFSNAWKWKVKVKLLSHVRLFATPWTAAYQAPPSMGFSRQDYWSGVPSPSPSSLQSIK